MILDVAPGAVIRVDGYPYTVEEHWSFFETDFRLDLVKLIGPSPAHERWLAAWQPDPYPMLLQRFEVDWLAPPLETIVHAGETYLNLCRGSGHRVRRTRGGRTKEGRYEYGLFRANTGRVILVIGRNDELSGWIGATLPIDAVKLP